jgi:hypothetical protein
MVLRLSALGILGLLLSLGSGCEPCRSARASAARPGADSVAAPAGGEAKVKERSARTEKSAQTKEVMVAVSGMT